MINIVINKKHLNMINYYIVILTGSVSYMMAVRPRQGQ